MHVSCLDANDLRISKYIASVIRGNWEPTLDFLRDNQQWRETRNYLDRTRFCTAILNTIKNITMSFNHGKTSKAGDNPLADKAETTASGRSTSLKEINHLCWREWDGHMVDLKGYFRYHFQDMSSICPDPMKVTGPAPAYIIYKAASIPAKAFKDIDLETPEGKAEKELRNRVDLALFGWSPSYPLVSYSVNPVFRQGSPALLDLITSLGSVFLKADRTAASLEVPLTQSIYMSFSPLGSVYHAQQSPGSYVSMTCSLQSYKYYFDLLETVQPTHKTYLLLAIIYDFMAFTAQLYSRMLGKCRLNLTNMAAIRATLQANLSCILTADMTEEYNEYLSSKSSRRPACHYLAQPMILILLRSRLVTVNVNLTQQHGKSLTVPTQY
jgi:hypothetical protein